MYDQFPAQLCVGPGIHRTWSRISCALIRSSAHGPLVVVFRENACPWLLGRVLLEYQSGHGHLIPADICLPDEKESAEPLASFPRPRWLPLCWGGLVGKMQTGHGLSPGGDDSEAHGTSPDDPAPLPAILLHPTRSRDTCSLSSCVRGPSLPSGDPVPPDIVHTVSCEQRITVCVSNFLIQS